MVRAGIVGFRGYSGAELVRLLERHPSVEPVLIEHRQALETSHLSHVPRRVRAVSLRVTLLRVQDRAHSTRYDARRPAPGANEGRLETAGRNGGRHGGALALGDHAPGAQAPDHHPDSDEFAVVWRIDAPRYAQSCDISVARSERELCDYPANTSLPKGRSSIRWRRASPDLLQLVRSFEHRPHLS